MSINAQAALNATALGIEQEIKSQLCALSNETGLVVHSVDVTVTTLHYTHAVSDLDIKVGLQVASGQVWEKRT